MRQQRPPGGDQGRRPPRGPRTPPPPQGVAELRAPRPAGAGSGGIFVKTKMCRFHILGMCSKGTACTFAHMTEELQTTPDLYRTKLCKVMLATGQCLDDACRFAHTKDELRTTAIQKKAGAGRGQQRGCGAGDAGGPGRGKVARPGPPGEQQDLQQSLEQRLLQLQHQELQPQQQPQQPQQLQKEPLPPQPRPRPQPQQPPQLQRQPPHQRPHQRLPLRPAPPRPLQAPREPDGDRGGARPEPPRPPLRRLQGRPQGRQPAPGAGGGPSGGEVRAAVPLPAQAQGCWPHGGLPLVAVVPASHASVQPPAFREQERRQGTTDPAPDASECGSMWARGDSSTTAAPDDSSTALAPRDRAPPQVPSAVNTASSLDALFDGGGQDTGVGFRRTATCPLTTSCPMDGSSYLSQACSVKNTFLDFGPPAERQAEARDVHQQAGILFMPEQFVRLQHS